MNHKTPEINTGATADIAFLLLIFFMITTTFETDRGIMRKLPEWQEEIVKSEVRERNLLPVWINSRNQIMIKNEAVDFREIRKTVRNFLLNPENDPTLPEKCIVDVDEFKNISVTKGVISIQNSRETNYETYIRVLNELEAAGMELKNEFSRKYYKKPYSLINEHQQDLVRKACPCMISEAEPVAAR